MADLVAAVDGASLEFKNATVRAAIDERIRDVVASLLVAGANVTIETDDPGNTITITATGGGGAGASLYGDGAYGSGLYGAASAGGGGAWGEITGPLSAQTDLQAALDAKADDADLAGKANTSHAHAATDVTSGTFATARLGSGAADSTKFLRGDGAWASPPGSGTGVEVFQHGTNAAAIRPVTSNMVIWVGTVQPTNWIDNDQWINAAPV